MTSVIYDYMLLCFVSPATFISLVGVTSLIYDQMHAPFCMKALVH